MYLCVMVYNQLTTYEYIEMPLRRNNAKRQRLNDKEKDLLRQIKEALAESSLPRPMHKPVPWGLRRAVGEFRADHRDGRGVTQPAGRRTRRLLERVLRAIGHARQHPDGNVQRKAKELVRSSQHESFERIEERAKRFVGLMNKSGHRRNEELRRARRIRLDIDDGAELVEVPTVDSLRSVGRALDLCVANQGYLARDYHHRLAHGESKFYALVVGGRVKLLMEVNEENEISEISARSNGEVALSRKRALRILEALNATADREPAFAGVGAFSPYLCGGKPDDRKHLTVNERCYRVDVFAKWRQVVVLEQSLQRGRVLGWSLFQREAPRGKGLTAWHDVYCGGVDLGQFAALLYQREVAAMINRLFD